MVQLLEELPPELQAHIACCLDDAAAAGRWAQASGASRLLLLRRLNELLEVRRSARQQAMLDKLSRPRRGAAAALSVYHMGDGDAAIRVLARNFDRFTCVCCPGDCELQIGYRQGCANVQRHLTSKQHWASYRQHRFMAWALMRSPGTCLRRAPRNLDLCSREKQACSRHSSPAWLYNLL